MYTCSQCGIEKSPDKFRNGSVTYCKECWAKHVREYRHNNLEHMRQIEREYNNAYRKDEKDRLRKQVISTLGGECAWCGENIYELLTVDHINGRREGKRKTGNSLARLVRQEGFPKDKYQILCWNCNCSKGIYGESKVPYQENKNRRNK